MFVVYRSAMCNVQSIEQCGIVVTLYTIIGEEFGSILDGLTCCSEGFSRFSSVCRITSKLGTYRPLPATVSTLYNLFS
jgi:hypothetical protein